MGKPNNREVKDEIKKTTYTCPICGKEHKDEEYCPIVIKKLSRIKPEYQSNIMGGILLECLDRGVDFIQTLKEVVYFVENGTKRDGAKFFDIDLFVSYFATTLECSPLKFSKRMKEIPDRFDDILQYSDFQDITPSVDENKMINSIEMNLMGEDGPFWESVNYHDDRGFGPSGTSVYILKEMDGRKPTYHLRLLYTFNDRCFHSENTHYSTYSCEIYSEKEGRLKEYFEDNCDWLKISKEIPCSFLEASSWVEKLKRATQDGMIRWKIIDKEDGTYCVTTYGQSQIEIRIAKESSMDVERRGIYRSEFGDYICIRENERKLYHYGAANEYYAFGKPGGVEEEIIKDSMIRSLGVIINRWNIKQKENATLIEYSRRAIRKSDVLSVTYSFVFSHNGHVVIPYCGVVTILTPAGELIEEKVYLGRCNACGVYYIFRRDYDELCKKGYLMCKVLDASTGKTLSDPNFSFNSSSILSEMGYNVQAAANMTSVERQEILRRVIEQKKVSVNEILNLLELQIRLHSDRENYRNAVEKWKEDADFVKSYGKNSGRVKYMNDIEQK